MEPSFAGRCCVTLNKVNLNTAASLGRQNVYVTYACDSEIQVMEAIVTGNLKGKVSIAYLRLIEVARER